MRFAFMLPLLFGGLYGQSTESSIPHAQSAVPVAARYEVVQSHLSAKFTFKLDKYSGHVWQLVKGSDDNVKWQVVPVLGLPKITAAGGVRFQMFTSGLAGRHTFLLDTATGRSWVFTEFKDGNAWAPMMEVE